MRGAIAVCAVLGALSLLVVVSLPGAAQGPPVDNITRYGGPRLEVLRRVASGVQPKSVRVSPDGRRVYVCNFGRPDRDNVFVYDAETLERFKERVSTGPSFGRVDAIDETPAPEFEAPDGFEIVY